MAALRGRRFSGLSEGYGRTKLQRPSLHSPAGPASPQPMATRTCMALCILLDSAAFITALPRLQLAINGMALSDGGAPPFLDHTHQWPPVLTWTIHGGAADADLQQAAYALTVDGVSLGEHSGAGMRHTIPAPSRSNHAHVVALSATLTDGRVIAESQVFRTALLDSFGNATWIAGGTLLERQLDDLARPFADSAAATVTNATAFASGVSASLSVCLSV
eukprot:COSAG03_NODE_869_length_5567_cov_622.477601_1_plen_218_part_10